MMKVKNILFLVLIVAKIYHMKLICESICNGRNDCIESIPSSIINHTLGVEAQHLCYQNNTCFGVNDTTQIPVQQIPVIAFKDQELVFNIGTLLQPNFTFEILQSATYKHFVLCNSSEGTQLTYSQKTQTLIQLSNLEPGVHYLLFVSNNLLYSCLFGFRIQVTVHDHLCYTDDHTLCSSNGRCLLNATSSIYQCNCCAGYYGQFCEEFNGCSLKPCLNNGTCSDVDSGSMSGVNCSCEAQFTGHYCQSCVSGFTGSKCLTDIDECNKTQNMCNYGVCSNTFGSFICHCPVNVTGALCNIDLYDNCQSNPCGGNSTCVDMDGSFACHCPIGFTGQHCDIDINECINNTCSVEGTDNCVDLIGKYYCQCIPGYTGIDCEVDINECASAPCEHGGLCYDLLHKYSCACQPGYDGENCQNIANKCAIIKPCQNNGTCVRSGHNNRNYTCSCIPGWTGRNCSYEINECFSRPCLNNATCIDLFNTFSCACQLGWTGEMCENNIDMCALSLCENNSTCIDSMIGLDYTCVCIPGFTSRNCSINIDECATYNGSCNYGVCVDLINDFTCQCDQGWFGKHCDTDKDLCSQTPCVNFVSCENVNSTLGYKCVCKPGFTGDNCLTETDSCMNSSCQNGATCNSFLHFYNCTCAPGFEGQFCEHETNECSSNPCLNNGICKDFINQYFCDCPHGFNGSRCEHNINDCFSFPCKNNGSCIDKVNDYSCNCLSGFTSKDCSVHVCTIATTCQNNATCMQTYGGFQCICPPQFTGIRCESSINECLLTPCQNNGICIDLYNGYECSCKFPYSGVHCDTHLCDCHICQNGATCVSYPDNYHCQCIPGFTGRTCENNINECIGNSCNKNGTLRCSDAVNNYTCICHGGFTGRHCQTHVCQKSNLCSNGSCIKLRDGYNCSCTKGFSGSNCETNIDDCTNVTCGRGTCVDGINHYTCLCPPLTTGRHCEISLDFCLSSPCLHNATCTNVLSNVSYSCKCQQPYVGTNCQYHICAVSNPCLHGTCVAFQRNFTCACFPGFTGPLCDQNIDECFSEPCLNGGLCMDGVNNFTCKCLKNHTGSNCESVIDFCSSLPCLNNGSCVNNYATLSYECHCSAPYSGRQCQFHQCDFTNPCKNNGTCLRDPTGVNCQCEPGYTSDDCSVEVNECESTPCLNHGTCTDLINGYSCNCSHNFTGAICEKPLTYCNTSSCVNGGTCFSNYIKKTFLCACSSYYTGERCEVSLGGPCHSRPCGINGVCKETSNNSYECTCNFGFHGRYCETFACPCDNGRCVKYTDSSSYHCVCITGFVGRYCETFYGDCRNITNTSLRCVDPSFCQETEFGFNCHCPPHLQDKQCETAGGCRNSTCLNGGNCTGEGDNYKCNCLAGFTGTLCEHDINECFLLPCLNNGSCAENDLNSYKCYCSSESSGLNCEHKNGTVRMSATEVEQTESYVLSKLTSLLKTNDLTKSLGMLTSTIIPHFSFMTGETESMLFTNTRSPINSATWTQPRSYIFPTSVTSRTFDTSLNIVSRYTLHTQKSSVLRETRTKIKLTSGISHSLSDISIIATPALSAQTSKYTSKMPSKHTSMKFKTSATMFRSVLTSNKIMGSTTYMKSYSVDTKVSTAIKRLYSNFTLTTEVSSTIWTNRSTSSATTTPSFGSQYRTHFTNAVSPSTNTFLDGTSTALESKGTVISGSTSLYSTSQSTIVVSDNLNTMILPSTSQKKHTFIFSNTSALYFSTSSTVPAHTTEPITVPTTTQRPFVNLKCADEPCNGFDCINETDNGLHFRCVCPFPSVGPRCILGSPLHFARFNGHGFIELPSIPMNISTNTILMSFHTLSPNGLLLYTNHTQHKDFIKISIVDGFLEYSFSTGAESVSIQSTEAVNTGHIVLFTASYNTSTGTGTLSISGVETISKSLQSSLRHIGITSTWYIGGLRVGGKIKSNFTGCIKDFQVNSKPFTITDASEVVDWVSISECDIPACNRGACYNNATCIKDIYDLNRFECHCQPGYFGDNCRQRTDHCSGDPCNGGLCVWTANGRQCLCHYGRVGSTCLIDTVISVPQYSQFQNYSSYTEYPWSLTGRHATERFEIRLQFKVVATTYDELQDGLMVYLGQNDIGSVNDDFFAVGISAGYVVLIFNLGSGNALLRSGEQISLNRKWHFLVAGRTRQHGYLYMNSHDKVTKVTPGPLTGLNAYTPLYIGGVPNYNQLPPDLYAYFTTGFIGTIYDASIRTSDSSFIPLLTLMKSQVAASVIGIPVDGGLNVNNDGDNQCSRNPCANNGTCSSIGAGFTCHCQPPYKGNLCHDKELPCIDYNPCHPGSSCRADGFVIQCDCPLGWRGFFCTEQFNISQPYFKENSFLALPSLRVRTEFAMLIRFKADADNGLLFYASRNIQSTKGDFMAISLWQKYVYVRFNLGYVTTSMRTHTKISIGTWHSLYVRRVSRDAIMRLDNNAYVGVRSKGSMSMLDVGSMFYLGGVPYLSSINTAAVKDVRSQSDFIGCISAFMVNSYEFNLSVSSSSNMIGRNIGDCGSSCNKHQCKNNALCVPMNSTTYKCECSLGFIGDECGQAPQAFTLASFSSTSYWFTRASLLSSSTNGQYDLLFKSNRDGIIFWHGKLRGVKSDHVIVSIVDGNVHLRVSMGGQAAFSMINQSNFNDNNFHKLRINRIGNIIQFIVNGHTPKIVLINTVKSSLDNDGYFYLGGLPGEVAELSVGRYNAGFHGCIANVTLTGYDGFVNFASTDDARGKNVEPCV